MRSKEINKAQRLLSLIYFCRFFFLFLKIALATDDVSYKSNNHCCKRTDVHCIDVVPTDKIACDKKDCADDYQG